MKYLILAFFRRILAFLTAFSLFSPAPGIMRPNANSVQAYDPASADASLYADVSSALHPVSDMLYGAFFEDINFAADGGLYAEMVANRSFEFTSLAKGDALYGWSAVGAAGLAVRREDGLNANNPSYLALTNPTGVPAGVENRGFLEGMSIRQGEAYRLSFYAKTPAGDAPQIMVRLAAGAAVAAEAAVSGVTAQWQKYTATLVPDRTADQNVRLQLLIGRGEVMLDMVSLFPEDTFMGRENGLRRDLAELVAAMKPRFLRFPGGCVTEGIDDETDYSWKDSVGADENGQPLRFHGVYGDVAARRQGIDLWTDLGATEDPYPSFMSYGLGFFEYFQFAEDIGAAPVPVLSCGLYCQMRGRGPVPMDSPRFAAYVQDLLDLVEFANGPADSVWGRVRADLGHPEPFGLKYVCIGNENEGEVYFERYAAFYDALEAAKTRDPALYGDIELIYSAGASDGTHSENYLKSYEYARDWLAAHPGKTAAEFAAATDQHYYNTPQWFLQNADYYDPENYPRQDELIASTPYGGAIPVFIGEYAAQSNTVKAALAEAAYMTGLERNSDIVKMAAYAPLFGNLTASHWRPDLIWLDQSGAFGSVNYEVQRLFGANVAETVVESRLTGAAAEPESLSGAVGVGTWYTSAAFDNAKVVSNADGRALEQDAFSLPGLKWKWRFPTSGDWAVQKGRLVQSDTWMPYSDLGSQAWLGDAEWRDYTFTVDAEKLAGDEGFLIPFAVQDEANCWFWNLGGWGNTVSCLQRVQNGEKTGRIGGTVRPFSAETGRTYALRVTVTQDRVQCFVDGELYIDYTLKAGAGADLYQTSGVDEDGDLTVKLVNVAGEARTLAVNVPGAGHTAAAEQLTPAAAKADADPLESTDCAVRSFTLELPGDSFNYTVPPYSVTVLRFRGSTP